MIHYKEYQPTVYLDTIDYEDADLLRGWRNDIRIRRWCRQFELISSNDQTDWIAYQAEATDMTMLKIMDGSKCPVGVCGLTSIDLINRRAEVTCYIEPSKQGVGLARAALISIFRHGFEDLGLHMIWAEVFENNGAKHLFESIGLVKEGIRREFYWKEGQYWDAILYSIANEEFTSKYIVPETVDVA